MVPLANCMMPLAKMMPITKKVGIGAGVLEQDARSGGRGARPCICASVASFDSPQ